jgi:hypothetical protein
MTPDPYPAVRLGFSLCKPTSEGRLSIQSADSAVPPKFFGNYLSTEYDQKDYDYWNEVDAKTFRNRRL